MISRDREQEKQEIKEGLKARIESLCAQLLPDGRRQGRLWVLPWLPSSHAPSTGAVPTRFVPPPCVPTAQFME